MKNKIICLLMCFCIISTFVFIPNEKASADALTASMVASGAFAIGQSFGITFTNAAWNSLGTMNMMEEEVSSYCGSRSIAEVFGTEAMKAISGKIVVGHVAYNAITNFLHRLVQKYDLSTNRVGIGFMFADDYIENTGSISLDYLNGWQLDITAGDPYWSTKWVGPDGQHVSTGNNNVLVASYDPVQTIYSFYGTNSVQAIVLYSNSLGSTITRNHGTLPWSKVYPKASERPTQVFGTSTGDIGSAVVLNPGQGWSGKVNGYEGPDTNLDELMGQVFQDVADFNLDVDGEIIDIPIPPEPAPTPVVDVIDGLNTQIGQLDGIGNDIGNIADNLDDLGALEQEAVDALDGIQEGIGTQTGILGGINTKAGSIDQTLTDTQDIVNDISNTLTDALDVPSAQESSDYKFDLSTLFPFCIPFDIARMLHAFDGAAVAPHFQIPIVISSIGFSYTLDLDFQIFDPVAAVLRQVELIAFAIALAYATSKVIRW